jgi:hypothetical protein
LIRKRRIFRIVSIAPGSNEKVFDGISLMKVPLFIIFILCACRLPAQTNRLVGTNASFPPVREPVRIATNAPPLTSQDLEAVRQRCLNGRRLICGKIIKVLPEGLVVEGGYTNLLRAPLAKSWLAPGTVVASREPNLVEGKEPGAIAVGLVLLTDLPRSRAAKPRQYDYVVIQAYPAGMSDYDSVGAIKRKVRRFAATLPQAVRLNLVQ